MKKHALIYIGVLLLLLAAVTAFRLRPAEPENSVLYERYKDMPGVRVGFIQDYPLNDSTTCDVTTFEALTDEGWENMVDELRLQSVVETHALHDSILRSKGASKEVIGNTIALWYCQRFHPEVTGDSTVVGANPDIALASIKYRWVAFYHPSGEKQEKEVVKFYVDYQVDHPMVAPTKQGNTI